MDYADYVLNLTLDQLQAPAEVPPDEPKPNTTGY